MQPSDIFKFEPIHYDVDHPCAISPPTHYAKSMFILKLNPELITHAPSGELIEGEVREKFAGRHEICENCFGTLLYAMTKTFKDLQDLKRA